MDANLNKGIVSDFATERTTTTTALEYDKKDQFSLNTHTRKYERQFFSMYQYRMKHLRERVYANAISKWGDGEKRLDGNVIVKQDKILDITSGKICWVIGTVFCDLKHKLNILNDVEHGTDDVLPIFPASYIDENNKGTIMIEDESGRAILSNDDFLTKNLFVTGSIVAVLGIEVNAGVFEVVDMVYPTVAPQKELSVEKGKIAIVSGLNICGGVDDDLKLELLKQMLVGEVGNDVDAQSIGGISRLIIAGDSIALPTAPLTETKNDFVSLNNYGSKNTAKFDNDGLQKFDQFVSELIPSIPVSIMPGANDPQEICLPQQAFHRSILASSKPYMNEYLQMCTNPQWYEINGVRMLATSGQNNDDVIKYLTPKQLQSPDLLSKIMTTTMKWQNIIPTAPDTLYCYPYSDFDPFVLEETPHIYFVGNQAKYTLETIEIESKKILTVTIPKFSETGEVVIINLHDMSTEIIKIEI